MAAKTRRFLRRCTPPIIVDTVNYFRARPSKNVHANQPGDGTEKPAEWYDESFAKAEHWRQHYTSSRYYFFWSVIVDRLLRSGVERVLDIGCGPGQFALLARDRGIKKYWGLDFSTKRIEQARTICPEFLFFVEDVFKSDKLGLLDYQAVVITEVLEHVENDIDLLKMVRCGTRLIGSVPNFPYTSHVRHFEGIRDVEDRYNVLFESLSVEELIANETGKCYYLLDGVKN
ncbi:class I SAM-dependent methyltransferase [Thalassoroseus pseudoceratinae]|uniref:class I SAM-dependent methyltransferase n=1 Tax=Thalassoroseus pseudoceratinae TaxID=2713176 RepID=UPI00141EAFD2|nr:class I SAM-dependent methyltransferase [Thalassoroseus pseudoceratinae]